MIQMKNNPGKREALAALADILNRLGRDYRRGAVSRDVLLTSFAGMKHELAHLGYLAEDGAGPVSLLPGYGYMAGRLGDSMACALMAGAGDLALELDA